MSEQIEKLESDYRKYAGGFGRASERRDPRAANRDFDKLAVVRTKLKAHGKEGEAVLKRLMGDRCAAVATCAAVDSLRFAEAQALEVLDAIGKRTGPVALDAEMSAELWRAGKLEI